jgi:hypothetical protein
MAISCASKQSTWQLAQQSLSQCISLAQQQGLLCCWDSRRLAVALQPDSAYGAYQRHALRVSSAVLQHRTQDESHWRPLRCAKH